MKKEDLCHGKELREEVVFAGVSGELAETFKVYLESCASKFELIKGCSSLVLVIKRSSERSVCRARKGPTFLDRTSLLDSFLTLGWCLSLLAGSKRPPSLNLTSVKVSFLLTFDIFDNYYTRFQCYVHRRYLSTISQHSIFQHAV